MGLLWAVHIIGILFDLELVFAFKSDRLTGDVVAASEAPKVPYDRPTTTALLCRDKPVTAAKVARKLFSAAPRAFGRLSLRGVLVPPANRALYNAI